MRKSFFYTRKINKKRKDFRPSFFYFVFSIQLHNPEPEQMIRVIHGSIAIMLRIQRGSVRVPSVLTVKLELPCDDSKNTMYFSVFTF